mgnify:CR=1 FL=1
MCKTAFSIRFAHNELTGRGSGLVFLVAVGALTFRMVENNLTHAHTFGRYFHVLVFANIFQGFLQREDGGRNDTGLLIGAGGTHVGQLFALGNVHHQVVFVNMFSYDLSGVDRILRFDEEFASVLQVIDGVGESRSAFDGPKLLIARRCQRDSAYGPCDRKINSAPTTEGRRFGAGLTVFFLTVFSNPDYPSFYPFYLSKTDIHPTI